MMKKFMAILMVAVLMLCGAAFATEEMTAEEIAAKIEQLETELETYRGLLDGQDTVEPAEEYEELSKGSKGDAAKKLQSRLIELGYLDGAADGIYGNGTAGAVSSFQSQNGLPVTGKADVATQELLFSDAAQKAIVYESLEYMGVSRDPDQYEGRYVKFNGKVLQVIEYGDTVSFRIASKGNYENVVYVMMEVPENYSRILEDDKVTVKGMYGGLYSYTTVRGDEVTIPLVNASVVTLR